ncbi:MAG: MarC family protein [Candidatus Nitrosopolaris sp.]
MKTGKKEIPIILVRTMVTKEEFKQIPYYLLLFVQNRHYGLSRHVFSFRNCISNPRLSSSEIPPSGVRNSWYRHSQTFWNHDIQLYDCWRVIVAIELLTHGVWRFGGSSVPDESGVVPLAFPLLAGPGVITSVIISYQATGFVVTILSIAIVIGITYIILLFVNPIYRLLGKRGSMIVTRVFAVFIAAIAI